MALYTDISFANIFAINLAWLSHSDKISTTAYGYIVARDWTLASKECCWN